MKHKKDRDFIIPVFFSCLKYHRILWLSGIIGCIRIEGDQIQPTDSHESVDDPGKPAHTSKKKGDKIQIEKSNQSPIDGTDDRNGQCNIV